MASKPFIIKSKIVQPMLPKDSDFYDEAQQTRIQILQAINGYLTVMSINMLYESFKLIWSYWHYQVECPDYAYLSLGFMAINIIWALLSYWGFKTIRSKNSRNIKLFGYCVIVNFVLRIIMYIVCGAVMHGYVPSMIVTPQQIKNTVCSALYPETLYIVEGIFQGLISLLVLFLAKSVYHYVKRWENSETQKYQPIKLNQMTDY